MQTIAGYRVIQTIHRGEKHIIHRAKKDGKKVIIKQPTNEYPTLEELKRIRTEYAILQKFNVPGITKAIAIEKYKNTLLLIFEDIQGESLDSLLKTKGVLIVKDFLFIAIQITKAIAGVHETHVIHKDIKPHNIVYNAESSKLEIIDFGSASLLSKETPSIIMANFIEGTLAYISPEQTGRMNRLLDYRTDYYSLGVTLYQLITGKLPFESNDTLELIHSHIAIVPESPENLGIPKAISEIILKLMSKNAEDRYQSAVGILYDLEWCLKNVKSLGAIPFTPGLKDVSLQFQIPEKLYGREDEIQNLIVTFQTIIDAEEGKRNLQLMLVAGHPGVGKSTLINEINKPIVEYNGYFVSGKYDQYRRNTPYSAIIQAFQELTNQILTETKETIAQWKTKLSKTLGTNGQVIVDVIPGVELIIGKQPAVPTLAPTEHQNRFNIVFRNFIKLLATKEHPLVLFLDDLQWADTPSIHLLKEIYISKDIHHLFLIFAYRDNEVDSTHPFYLMLEDLKKQGFTYKEIYLKPLAVEYVNSLVADALHSDYKHTEGLAKILTNKTGGNPFFVNEFLKTLHKESLIYYENGWKWDEKKIQEVKITDNVVELMADKISNLSEASREVMKYASCIGSKFYLDILSLITNKSGEELFDSLKEVVKEGMILMSKEYARFIHDRVREATYSLLSEDEKTTNHYQIGKILLENTPEDKLEDQIFVIVGQLNSGKKLIQMEEEKLHLAKLNLLAGKKAKESTAYDGALTFLNVGAELLSEDKWKTRYNLTFEIYHELSECEYLATNFENADKLYETILQNATSLMDKVKIYNIQLRQKASEFKPDEAFQVGFAALNQLGIETPTDSGSIQAAFMQQLGEYQELLGTKPIPSLYNMQDMTNENMLEAISLVTNLGDIAIAMKGEMLPLMSIMGVNLSLKYGNVEVSPISYVMMGVITNLVFKDYKKGYELGQLAIRISQEKFPSDLILGKVYAFYGWNINHYIHHLREDLNIAQKGYDTTMANSDLVYAGYFILMFLKVSFCAGIHLDEVIGYGERNLSFATKYKVAFVTAMALPTIMLALALQGKTENPLSFNNEAFNEERYIQENLAFGQPMAYFYLRKYQLYIYYGEYKKCLEVYPDMEKFYPAIPQHIAYVEVRFCYALSLIALMSKFNEEEKAKYGPKFKESYDLFELWSEHCEDNFKHKYLLIKAEKTRIEGNDSKAMQFYSEAVQLAKKYEYTNDVAFTNELAAKFFLVQGMDQVAAVFLREAHYYYRHWGAEAKVKQLEEQYPDLIPQNQKMDLSTMTYTSIDLNSLMKASRAISGEVKLDSLSKNLLNIIIENAGAERGILLLEEQGEFLIFAEAKVSGEYNSEKRKQDNSILPVSVIQYVFHTNENIILHQAKKEKRFANDKYISQNQILSIACVPILNQNQLLGILYMENNLSPNVFTQDRVETIQLLSSQAGISIHNSILYENMEQKVIERTAQINEMLDRISTLYVDSENKRKEIESLAESRKKLSLIGQMAAGIVHDIKNPIASIKALTEMANTEEIGRETRIGNLKLIGREADRLNDMAYEILDFSKGELSLELCEVNLREFLDGICKFLKIDFEYVGINLLTDLQYEGIVSFDTNRMRRVIINLARNAIEAMNDGKDGYYLKIHTERRDNKLTISVVDNGPGIPKSMEEKIFEAFATEGKARGTGLGLFMCKWIIEAHKGELKYQTTMGEGTTFFIDLPL
ncbi:MAG: AAA family ATPase [Leptospiraceae bacterium]|nr:AAA family ATPase [Leptospiraceae bacterium]MCP5494723.1 AAA family ATPase [Leptospiraceae bacterium]